MKKNKIVYSFLLLSFLFMFSLYAQKSQPGDAIVTKMEKVLHLTDEQVSQIRPIVRDYTNTRLKVMQNFKDEGTIDKTLLYAQLKELRKEEYEKLDKILTKKQIKQWIDHQNTARIMNGNTEGGDDDDFRLPDSSAVMF